MAGLAKLQLLIDIKEKLNVGLNKAKQKVDRAVNGMQRKLNTISTGTKQAFGAITDQIPGVGGALGLLSNPITAITAGVIALAGALFTCTIKANEWRESLSEINVTAELSKDKLDDLSDKLLEIGSRNVAPLEEVPKAFNRIISAGLSVSESLDTIEPTLRAAKAGFTDVETAASAATSVMMSTGYDATRVFDILFETVKEGNAEFKDIAQYLPKVIPLAKNVGYELEEVAGAYAMLTGRLSTEQSTTALQGVMRALSSQRVAIGQINKATGKYVSGFKSIGIDVFDPATKKIKPILQIVTELNKKMAGLSDKDKMLQFDKIGLDQMATLGISSLMQDTVALQKAIDATTNSVGSLNKAYEDAASPMDSWKIIGNMFKADSIKSGQSFLSIIGKIGDKLLSVLTSWREWKNNNVVLQDSIKVVGTLFSWLFNMIKAAFKILYTNFSKVYNLISAIVSKIVEWIERVTGISLSMKGMYNNIRPYLIWIKEFLVEIGDLMYDIFTFNFDSAYDKINNFKTPDIGKIRQRVIEESNEGNVGVITKNLGGDNDSGDSGIITSDSTSISDGAKGIKGNSQTKNITINIDSFIKGFSPTHQSFNNMSMDEFERKMTEVFLRVVRSAETSM